jgi:hypothetical protein
MTNEIIHKCVIAGCGKEPFCEKASGKTYTVCREHAGILAEEAKPEGSK